MIFLLSTAALLKREVVRFLRQRHRIVGALATPLLFWILLGSGFGNLKYFFPGTVAMILLFTAIFSTISIIEDRREGFLQGVLVSPAPRASIVMGKMLGGTILATLQGLLFVCIAPLAHISLTVKGLMIVATATVLISFALTGLGFSIAWKLDSTTGFHSIMNLFLMPMWFLSGSMFPVSNAPLWLRAVMTINPLTYGVAALHHGFFPEGETSLPKLPALGLCFAVMLVFCLLTFGSSTVVSSKND